MKRAFPELKRERGNVYIRSGHHRPHWWLIAPNGDIVDPSNSQFQESYYGADNGIIEYIPLIDKRVPKGNCMNCGDLCFDHGVACTESCYWSLAGYYGNMGPYEPEPVLEETRSLDEIAELMESGKHELIYEMA